MMTPLGSAGGLQERVRVVAVGEAISIAGESPGTIIINKKYESKLAVICVQFTSLQCSNVDGNKFTSATIRKICMNRKLILLKWDQLAYSILTSRQCSLLTVPHYSVAGQDYGR